MITRGLSCDRVEFGHFVGGGQGGESGSFFTLSKPGLTSFLHTGVLKSQEKCPHGNKTLRDAWHKTQQTAEVCV